MLLMNSNNIEQIYVKVDDLVKSSDMSSKGNSISEVLTLMKELNREQIVDLMSDSNELVRNFAAKIYVEDHFDQSLDLICEMLNADDENVRDSAVISLNYMNSPNNLEILEKVTQDKSSFVKLRALTGIADIAIDYSNNQAKEVLQRFSLNDDAVIREFVRDELSLMAV